MSVLAIGLFSLGTMLVVFTAIRAVVMGGTLTSQVVPAYIAAVYSPGIFGILLLITARIIEQ